MGEIEQRSLQYLLGRGDAVQWKDFLGVLAEELNTQMPAVELRGFFRVLGRRMAERAPLPAGASLAEFEAACNARLAAAGWGWVAIHDEGDRLDLVHACAPLRYAFGDSSIGWSGGLLEGLHATWLKQAGAGATLELRQIGDVDGASDSFHFRLAHASLLA